MRTKPLLILRWSWFAWLPLALLHGDPADVYFPDRSDPRVSVEFLVAGRPLDQESSRYGPVFVKVPRWGVEYEIRLRNRERRDRLLFVIGIDGLSVLDGQPATQYSGGYVLKPREEIRDRGWRRGLDKVAAFTFASRGDSYAGRMGSHDHIGKIWVWAIREQRPWIEHRPSFGDEKGRLDGLKTKSSKYSRESGTGTGYGEELADPVRVTRFRRSDSIRFLSYRYDLRPSWRRDVLPDRREGAHVPAPPGWQGRSER